MFRHRIRLKSLPLDGQTDTGCASGLVHDAYCCSSTQERWKIRIYRLLNRYKRQDASSYEQGTLTACGKTQSDFWGYFSWGEGASEAGCAVYIVRFRAEFSLLCRKMSWRVSIELCAFEIHVRRESVLKSKIL